MKALIAMSGGVDSSVAAKIMVDAGYECIGCTMKLHDNQSETEAEKSCCSISDVNDARSVALKLNMPYYVFNFKDDFREKIINKFIESYKRGETPNPCIDCNRYMKFDKLFERAKELECDYIVTGHYVRIKEGEDGRFHLLKAVCESKDQSYVLYSMTQEQLAHAKFPLGDMEKTETRKLAEEGGFINADKPDSQDICFVPDGNYAKVIEEYSNEKELPGDFVDMDGNVMGTHKGITHYTIGQRKGLGLSLKEPAYVQRLDVENNRVILGSNEALFSKDLSASEVNWVLGEVPNEPLHCKAKIRYKHKEAECVVYPVGNDKFTLTFIEPQRAITPGQSVVLYDGDEVIGGGKIDAKL